MTRDLIFTVTPDHVALLRRAYVGWDDCEFGAPAIDCKRPYGNSAVEHDMAEILEWPVGEDGPDADQRARLREIHEGTRTALQIFLLTGRMEPGEYRRSESWTNDWQAV